MAYIRRVVAKAACLGLLLGFGALCRADDSEGSASYIALGPGFYMQPRYPGARRQRSIYFPFVDGQLDNRFYTSASDLVGVYGIKTPATQAGAALEYDLTERLSRDDARLHGLPDVKQTPRAKIFASHTLYMFTGDVNVATDVAGRGEGTLGQANLWVTIPVRSTFSINFGPGLTWADSRYMSRYFSVTPAEAADSSLTTFAARAGILDAHLNGLAEWIIAAHYRIGMQVCLSRLRHNVAESPIPLITGQHTLVAWLAYQFH